MTAPPQSPSAGAVSWRHPDASLPCVAPPSLALDGPDGWFLGTDEGEWLAVGLGGEARVLEALQPFSAARVGDDGALTVATFGGELATLEHGAWRFTPRESVVLSLARTRVGTVVGDATGNLTCLAPQGPALLLAVGEPVIGLAAVGERLLVLGGHGSLGVTAWPWDAGDALREVSAEPLDGPWMLSPSGTPGTVGVLGATRAGLVDVAERRVVATCGPFPEGLRSLAPLGDGTGYLLLTDAGELLLLDARLGSRSAARLPPGTGAIAGARSTRGRAVLAWTDAGELFVVDPALPARKLADGGVVLAFPDSHPSRAVAVHWSAAAGARLLPVSL